MDKSADSKNIVLAKSKTTLNSQTVATGNLGIDPNSRKQPWLHAWRDALIGIKAYTPCMRLCDVRGDGDYKMIVGDISKKLLVLKGPSVEWEVNLAHIPIAVCAFYHDAAKIPQPSIAVAADSSIYIFRNFKMFFKYDLPSLEWHKDELTLWHQFKGDLSEIKGFIDGLLKLKSSGITLSDKAAEILTQTSSEKRLELILAAKSGKLNTSNAATCMECIKKNSDDETAISMIVVGTENKELIIFDQNGTSVLKQFKFNGVPAFLEISGLLDVDYKIVALTRESRAYVIKNGEIMQTIIELESKPCGIARVDKNIFIGCMDKSIHCYTLKNNKKMYSISVPAAITNLESMEYGRTKSYRGFLVGLSNMELRMYNERQLVHILKIDDIVGGIRFGTFGRETGAMIILYKSRGMDIKILQRQFNINSSTIAQNQFQDEEIPLNMPKRTKLFVEQSQRERDQASEIYRTYMKDVLKMKLKIAQSYLKSLKEGMTQTSSGITGTSIKIYATVEGIGPLFVIRLKLENFGRQPAYNLKLAFTYDQKLYQLINSQYNLPVLVPNIAYPVEIKVESIDQNGTNDAIKVFIIEPYSVLPVVSAIVNMPLSELKIE